ncbi:MAG TPA: inorganic phosphate transporter [Candidatus Dormibacteraeota bacterium]|nr:inorganic phosphate transporter [Candidatus Dormibacteraeota bacterium]
MQIGLTSVFLIIVAFAFAWSMGAHYTGACMGMPYASGSIRLVPALVTMAILALIGATLASHKVEVTVGRSIIDPAHVTTLTALVIVAAAFLLTTAYTYLRIPTSTIQILVFSVVGAGLAVGAPIHWPTIIHLAILWVLAPFVACGLGWSFTHLIDRAIPSAQRHTGRRSILPALLVVVGVAASFTMGANDVSNATGVFLMTHLFGVFAAALIGGLGLALGVLTWGKPLLKTVAFDIVKVDLAMASAAQLVQALVVFTAVTFGYFTSMNQALIGAMAGTGLARGRETVRWPTLYGILKGWAIGPASGLALAYLLARFVGMF